MRQPEPVELGQHLIETLDDATVIVVKRTQWDAMVQLSCEEAYRLMITLQSWFADDELSAAGKQEASHATD